MNALGLVRTTLQPLILNWFATPLDVTCFGVAAMIQTELQRATVLAATPLQPPVTAMHAIDDRSGVRHAFLRGSRYVLWAVTFCVVPLIIYRREFIELYIGDRFILAAFVLGAALVPMAIRNATFMTGHLASAAANLRPLALRGIVVQVVIVALTACFVVAHQMGAAGAALAMMIGGGRYRADTDVAARLAHGRGTRRAVVARDGSPGLPAGADGRRGVVRPTLAAHTRFVVPADGLRCGRGRSLSCDALGVLSLPVRARGSEAGSQQAVGWRTTPSLTCREADLAVWDAPEAGPATDEGEMVVYSSLIFWLLLGIPGYAALRRFDADQLNSGLLGAICLSYLGTLILLTPVIIIGYLFRLPLAVFSGAYVVLVVAGLLDLFRMKAWRDMARLAAAAVGVELLLLAGDMWLSARTGSIMTADATVHLGRIRFLLDHGMSNADQYMAGDYFFHLYHTNLLHTLCAAAAQLTGVSHFGVWFAALPWAKLLAASGAYYLAWSVFGRRWPAWVAAAFVIGMQGPVTFMIYPNKLAPFWLLACVLGLVVQVCCEPRWRIAVWIGGAILVVGQIHSLYGGFALVLCGPVVAAAVVVHWRRSGRGVATLVGCGVALTLFLPFALLAKPHPVAAEKDDAVAEAVDDVAGEEPTAADPELDAHRFIDLGNAGFIKRPFDGFGSGGGYALLAGCWALSSAEWPTGDAGRS